MQITPKAKWQNAHIVLCSHSTYSHMYYDARRIFCVFNRSIKILTLHSWHLFLSQKIRSKSRTMQLSASEKIHESASKKNS